MSLGNKELENMGLNEYERIQYWDMQNQKIILSKTPKDISIVDMFLDDIDARLSVIEGKSKKNHWWEVWK